MCASDAAFPIGGLSKVLERCESLRLIGHLRAEPGGIGGLIEIPAAERHRRCNITTPRSYCL
jgi:hypothetical protein